MKETGLEFLDKEVTLVKIVGDRAISRTQSIKTLVIEREGKKLISFHKWWRKSANQPWQEGKGFDMDFNEASVLISALDNAKESLEQRVGDGEEECNHGN
ncbi:hypothetical protein [Paenibacillus polymyxa]|uniref:hypothetical protein n=1 Tax=Paenibacillus polymyxa TaxID=1406 RepID=UPI00234B0736|nr:hypothetical protein [Paenibacillus polymyxa]WCM61382.1 hypothetical protein OYT09_26210 [Paenibacillus polymyxa]